MNHALPTVRSLIVLATLGLLTLPALTPAPARADSHGTEVFQPFNRLLERYVNETDLPGDGLVSSFDYRAVLADEAVVRSIESQRAALADFDPDQLETRAEAIAFWINAYNFFMIAHIVDSARADGLIASVRDYGSLFNPYRVFKRKLFNVGGRQYSLSEIEIEVLLGERFRDQGWKDARVHFAVNCASVGCPPLRNRIYRADDLDALLDENTRRALATPLHLKTDSETLYLTRLFDWYEADFAEMSGSVRRFILDHADAATAERVRATNTTRFIDYDWDLNSPHNIQARLDQGTSDG